MKLAPIARWLRNFAEDTRGVMSLEFVLMMPPLFITYMAAYVYFDGYRQAAVNLKAAYTVSDLVSRETEIVNEAYIDSMYSLMQELTRTNNPSSIRISVVRWDEGDSRYYLDWSKARGGFLPRQNSSLVNIADRLPQMPDNERVILVETRNTFIPLYAIGMDNIDLDNFVFTRPRFAPQVVFES
ncbi:MAG: TadE/TadG family type IV pilus assembly protein [Paracoccaceae bacterium]